MDPAYLSRHKSVYRMPTGPRRYDLAHDGAAISRARARPRGWLERIERAVAVQRFNVNRYGLMISAVGSLLARDGDLLGLGGRGRQPYPHGEDAVLVCGRHGILVRSVR
jgi:hypothetical protein